MDRIDHIGVRELRKELSTVMRRAEAGNRIIVTVDGHPIAQLGPLTPLGEPCLDDLVATGQVQMPKDSIKPSVPLPAISPVDLSVERILQELRG